MVTLYMYVVDRDFGFAPNPFHGYCTLATCKPRIRARAQIGDWVIGMGGRRLHATGRCIFAMLVNDAVSFNDYWSRPEYLAKRPVRNGSRKMMVGDNIYHFDTISGEWHQADSHHSNADGTPNADNLLHDTGADRVLVSQHFVYFGREAPTIPEGLLAKIAYSNVRDYRVYDLARGKDLIDWLHERHGSPLNRVLGDPFDFSESDRRYSVRDSKMR